MRPAGKRQTRRIETIKQHANRQLNLREALDWPRTKHMCAHCLVRGVCALTAVAAAAARKISLAIHLDQYYCFEWPRRRPARSCCPGTTRRSPIIGSFKSWFYVIRRVDVGMRSELKRRFVRPRTIHAARRTACTSLYIW